MIQAVSLASLPSAGVSAERVHIEGQQVPRDFQAFPDGEAGDRFAAVRFTCTTKATPDAAEHAWYYTAALYLKAPDNPAIPAPGAQKMAELSVTLARQAAGTALGCTNTIQLPGGPYKLT
ncbi:hypothetical protein [Kitasatospora sp. NPDC089509]|uniref:hypothetical protein n=1 Tax=Kitasatospora sp. NPDC089509 TaxID=3364079 RepID=UPI0038162C29